MKGYFVWSLVALAALVVASCQPGTEPASEVKPVSNPVATPSPTPPVQEGLLGQVPDGYSELARWDVRALLAGRGAQSLQKDFRSEWEWIDTHGLKIEEVSEIIQAWDEQGNTLVLLAGEFDWDLIHNHLYYEGFVDSAYRDVEIWKHPEQDLVFALLPDRDQIVASPSGSAAVRDTIRALERGSGFLFEDLSPDEKLALARAWKGVHLVWEEGCDRLEQRGCEITAYGAQWGEDEFTVELVWLFGFQDGSSARTAVKKLGSFFEGKHAPGSARLPDKPRRGVRNSRSEHRQRSVLLLAQRYQNGDPPGAQGASPPGADSHPSAYSFPDPN